MFHLTGLGIKCGVTELFLVFFFRVAVLTVSYSNIMFVVHFLLLVRTRKSSECADRTNSPSGG